MAESEIITRLIAIVDEILSGNKPDKISFDDLKTSDNPLLNELSEKLCKLNNQYNEGYQFIMDLSRGKLDTEISTLNKIVFPYKRLQSELRYLSWQVQQIADGDYNQRVQFSGDFSYAINKMARTLRERHGQADTPESDGEKNNP